MGRNISYPVTQEKQEKQEDFWKLTIGRYSEFTVDMKKRPLCGYWGASTTAGAAIFSIFEQGNTDTPFRSEDINTMAGMNALSNTEQAWKSDLANSYTTTLNTQSLNPQSGYNGISQLGDVYNHTNFVMTSRGVILPEGYYSSNDWAQYSGVVIGEESYVRGLGIWLNNGRLYSGKKKFTHTAVNSPADADLIDLVAQDAIGAVGSFLDYMTGSFSYNRRANTAMLVEYVTAYSGFRLHIWKNLDSVFGFDQVENVQILARAKATGNYQSVSYNTSTAGGYGGTSTNDWKYNAVIIPCDDGTAWISHRHRSASQLYSFDGTTVTMAHSLNASNGYGIANGDYYNTKTQVSGDQSTVAIYSHYYYYLLGANIFLVDTYSASDFGHFQNTSSGNSQCSIAACGGNEFVYAYTDNGNTNYNPKVAKRHLSLNDKVGNALPTVLEEVYWPHRTTSTAYSGRFVFRLQDLLEDTTEYAESGAK